MKPASSTQIRSNKPTPKQLRYLRQLAERTATTFAMPTDIEEASAEITRLLKLTQSSRADRTREKRAVQRDLAERPDDATQVRSTDVVGYGSNCRWAHRSDDEQRS